MRAVQKMYDSPTLYVLTYNHCLQPLQIHRLYGCSKYIVLTEEAGTAGNKNPLTLALVPLAKIISAICSTQVSSNHRQIIIRIHENQEEKKWREGHGENRRAIRGGPSPRDFVRQFISHYLKQCGYLGAKGRIRFTAKGERTREGAFAAGRVEKSNDEKEARAGIAEKERIRLA